MDFNKNLSVYLNNLLHFVNGKISLLCHIVEKNSCHNFITVRCFCGP